MRRVLLVLAIGFVVAIAPAYGENWSGKCVRVKDGDTIVVMHGEKDETIRLQGVDCPEGNQDFSKEAKQFTEKMVKGKTVNVETITTDKYGRTVAKITVEGKSLEKELVKSGSAWWFRKYAPNDKELEQLEAQARKDKIGLWAQPNPIAPWCYRHPEDYPEECPPPSGPFHGNVKSKIFHSSICKHYNCKKCTAEFATKEAAFEAGYKPCSQCCNALLKELKGGKPSKASSQRLTQDEVIRIAEETARTEGLDPAKYNMTPCLYAKKDHSWTVFFTLKPPTPPGGHFGVSIDDQTKKAKLMRGE